MVRLYMISLAPSEMINDFEWSVYVDDWKVSASNLRVTDSIFKSKACLAT